MSNDTAGLQRTLEQAIALHMSGQLDRARPLYEEILAMQPRHMEALGKLAALSIQNGNPQRAIELLDKALLLDPSNAINYCNRGAACERLRQWDAALGNFDRAIALKPDLAQAHSNRANVLRELQRWQDALSGYERAIALQPTYVNAHNNRGKLLMEFGEFEKALASYGVAVALKPDFADGHYNRAILFGKMGRPHQALASYDLAIAIQPDLAPAYFNRALIRLLVGDFDGGWADYEWRWKNENIALARQKRSFRQPRWIGDEAIAGKTILIHSEQGFGDTLQFCRYVPMLAALGANVVFEVQKPLIDLVQGLEGVTAVIGQGEALPPFELHCALMSLPLAFKTNTARIPARVPYLRADAARVSVWGHRINQSRKLRVGLVWSSGVRPTEPNLADLNRRNVPLTKFAEILKNSNMDFYSLQKGQPAESELAQASAEHAPDVPITDLTALLSDFSETAALIEHLDLVISVDTAVAHLAGALGKPVWILICTNACWRWLQDRSDNPWYPTVRLYRQQSAGDWDEVIDRVNADLKQLAKSALHSDGPTVTNS
jgi:tetratricopeptide (TPR) repeat protein